AVFPPAPAAPWRHRRRSHGERVPTSGFPAPLPLRTLDAEEGIGNGLAIEGALADEGELAADLFHGAARADVVGADVEPHALGPAEGVVEHQLFHFAVVASSPVAALEEGITDGDFLLVRFPVVVARAADHAAVGAVDYHEGRPA